MYDSHVNEINHMHAIQIKSKKKLNPLHWILFEFHLNEAK